MKSEGKGSSRRVVIPAVILMTTISLLVGLFVVRASTRLRRSYRHRLVRLLCETDYQVLLEACRELSARVARGELKAWTYGVRRNPAAEASTFPQVILAIQPAYVLIEKDGRVCLEMFGYPSYGVVAFPKNYQIGDYHLGDVELIPGLWYYDEDYQRYADRREDIDSMVERGRGITGRELGAH